MGEVIDLIGSTEDGFDDNPQNVPDAEDRKRSAKEEAEGSPAMNDKNIDPILIHGFDGDDESSTTSILDSNTIDKELRVKLRELLKALNSMTKTPNWFHNRAWDDVDEHLKSSKHHSEEKHRRLIKKLLTRYRDDKGRNLIQVAFRKRAPLDILKYLIDAGGKDLLWSTDNIGQNALFYAVDSTLEIVKKIIEIAGDEIIVQKDREQRNALGCACSFSASREVIELLIEKGGGANLVADCDRDNFTSLHYACRSDADSSIVNILLEKGPSDLVSMQTVDGWTALHHACYNNARPEIIQLLVNRGHHEIVGMGTKKKNTALHFICARSIDPSVLEILLKSYKKQNEIDCDEVINALFKICARGLFSNMLMPFTDLGGGTMITHHVRSKLEEYENKSILHVACSTAEAKFDTISLLMKVGGKRLLKVKDDMGNSIIHYCVKNNVDVQIIRTFIDVLGDDWYVINRKGNNALHYTSSSTPLEVIDLLASKKASFEIGKDGDYPLDCMIKKRTNYPSQQIIHLQEYMYEHDPNGYELPHDRSNNSKKDAKQKHATLKCIRDLPKKQRIDTLKGNYVWTVLNNQMSQPIVRAVILLDILVQIVVVWEYSFNIDKNMNFSATTWILFLLSFLWITLREAIQFYSSNFWAYVSDVSNVIDLTQIYLMICTFLRDIVDINLLHLQVFCVGISWLRLIFVCSNVIYKVKVFLSALESITKHLLPFIFVTTIIVISFAHMFHVAGPLSNVSCLDESITSVKELRDEYQTWTCSLNDSYFHSFAMLLSGDFLFFDSPSGLRSTLSFIFAAVIGIILLNILIAVVNDSFKKVEDNSEYAFWLGRLRFIVEMQGLLGVKAMDCMSSPSKITPKRRIFTQWDNSDSYSK
ncbi:hypothetical protein CTEN210_00975 [Chaetoceros tenuissimus]|uniref:Ion transport domain-containing protein n=1 Tax=Chaetoceros tenuissimus TaxID=426638 RepID=A0AAD3CET8_9STRA|nr:hypothetical protein CTEN210_00975 [Chaetoceros tenuissimus]